MSDLTKRLREMAADIDSDWAANNQPASQGGPSTGGQLSPRPINTPAEAADRLDEVEAALEQIKATYADGWNSGDRHARCVEIATATLKVKE